MKDGMRQISQIVSLVSFFQMTLQAKWMSRRPLKKKQTHCKYAVEDFVPSLWKRFTSACHFTRGAFFSQSFPRGRRKLAITFHPSVPSDEDCKWRRAQHHCCRATAGLHDHSMSISASLSLSCFWFWESFHAVLVLILIFFFPITFPL